MISRRDFSRAALFGLIAGPAKAFGRVRAENVFIEKGPRENPHIPQSYKARLSNMRIVTFPVKQFGPAQTNVREDLAAFIVKHEAERECLIVQVDTTGLGDCVADHLEDAGFTVKREQRTRK